MIRAEAKGVARPFVNPMRGEFETLVAGERHRFDTRLSTVATIEAACGDRPIVEILNAVIAERRARDVIPLLAAALAAADPATANAAMLAQSATVGEAEAFVLALIFALGFKVGQQGEAREALPLPPASAGVDGVSSRSAA